MCECVCVCIYICICIYICVCIYIYRVNPMIEVANHQRTASGTVTRANSLKMTGLNYICMYICKCVHTLGLGFARSGGWPCHAPNLVEPLLVLSSCVCVCVCRRVVWCCSCCVCDLFLFVERGVNPMVYHPDTNSNGIFNQKKTYRFGYCHARELVENDCAADDAHQCEGAIVHGNRLGVAEDLRKCRGGGQMSRSNLVERVA